MASKEFSPEALVASAWKIIPIFPSRDIHATVRLYTQELGFILGSEKPDFASLGAGPKAASNIYFQLYTDGQEFTPSKAMIAMGAEQLDALYTGLQAKQQLKQEETSPGSDFFKIVEEIEDKPWGFRQFSIADSDGNQIFFFRFLEGSNGEEYWSV
jgi:catechol 2,3-dioxygenase-like lactoylglutathione lyase family enzyme